MQRCAAATITAAICSNVQCASNCWMVSSLIEQGTTPLIGYESDRLKQMICLVWNVHLIANFIFHWVTLKSWSSPCSSQCHLIQCAKWNHCKVPIKVRAKIQFHLRLNSITFPSAECHLWTFQIHRLTFSCSLSYSTLSVFNRRKWSSDECAVFNSKSIEDSTEDGDFVWWFKRRVLCWRQSRVMSATLRPFENFYQAKWGSPGYNYACIHLSLRCCYILKNEISIPYLLGDEVLYWRRTTLEFLPLELVEGAMMMLTSMGNWMMLITLSYCSFIESNLF